MKHYRINKVIKPGGAVIKTQDVLAKSDQDAVERAKHADCPVCEVLKDGKPVNLIA